MSAFQIIEGWRPGAPGFLIFEHGRYYARHWGFGAPFEAKVAAGIGGFLARYEASRDRLFLAMQGEAFLGGLVIDGHFPEYPSHARLRWFILADAARGRGIGTALMQAAMAHVDGLGCACSLGTFAGLDGARALYEKHGFALIREQDGASWGVSVREQEFLRPAPAIAARPQNLDETS